MKTPRIIISGGGTGGHIFPAIAIANEFKRQHKDAEILFVGAKGRMEMQRVPAAGYRIEGLPVSGFDRKHLLKNIPVLFKIVLSQIKAYNIIRKFKPQAVIGVGGFASGPTLKTAAMMGIPTLIQEQNSYAGVTNKLLAKKAKKICVAYPDMERFFDKDKIIMTGNPVRQDLADSKIQHNEAVEKFGLSPEKKTILILGGSLGAQSINECLMKNLGKMKDCGMQFIWQTGKIYIEQVKAAITAFTDEAIRNARASSLPNLYVTDFIKNMNSAYTLADLVISRAGAGSISEFCLLGKPVILIPSPNVAEDHQTKNALALVNKDAALYVKDAEAQEKLLSTALETITNDDLLKQLNENISKLALPDSARIIAQEVLKLIDKK